jgi:hypothetical protein
MTIEEYLEARAAMVKDAEPYLWRYVDVALPLGEYTQEQRKEAVFRMAHDVAVMQHQTPMVISLNPSGVKRLIIEGRFSGKK